MTEVHSASSPVSVTDIERAAHRLAGIAHRTPLIHSRTFDAIAGNEVHFKAENFQRIGAFKIRGAYNTIALLAENERRQGVIAHSSGNHAQGVALAAKLFGTKAVIVMPENSVSSKVEATKAYGAEVVFCGVSTDDRERVTNEILKHHSYTLIHPYNDPRLIAGQGTVGREIFEDGGLFDYLFVPIGGGGLISGCAVAAKHLCPTVKVIGVETEGSNDCYQSFRKKSIVKLERTTTIADGMRTLSVGALNFDIIQTYVDDVITVADEDVLAMMRFFLERMKVVVEPTGAVAPAAVMKNKYGLSGKRICAVISGGNVDRAVLKSLCS